MALLDVPRRRPGAGGYLRKSLRPGSNASVVCLPFSEGKHEVQSCVEAFPKFTLPEKVYSYLQDLSIISGVRVGPLDSLPGHCAKQALVAKHPESALTLAFHHLWNRLGAQEMQPKTMEMFSRGLPLWQKLLMPILGAGVISTMNQRFVFTEEISANMTVVYDTFRRVANELGAGVVRYCQV